MRNALGAAVTIAWLGSSAMAMAAATVVEIEGTVSLNHAANGYHVIKSDTPASAGDSVLAGDKSQAYIVYDDGCRVKVDAGHRIIVSLNPPCLAAAPLDGLNGNVLVGATIVGGGAAGLLIWANQHRPASP